MKNDPELETAINLWREKYNARFSKFTDFIGYYAEHIKKKENKKENKIEDAKTENKMSEM